jgi:hypothetical protein
MGFAKAVTVYPFIFLKYKEDLNNKTLLNHEKIHLAQQKELFFIGFFILYFYHFFKIRTYFNNKTAAYRAICFEKESKINENILDYLINRKKYSWKKYA